MTTHNELKKVEEWRQIADEGCFLVNHNDLEGFEQLVPLIQANALRFAAQLVHDMSRGTHSEERAIAIDEARDLINESATQLEGKPNERGEV